MASTVPAHPYSQSAAPAAQAPSSHYSYRQPQGPPSPPGDEAARCSLPSIANLLDLADQGSPTSETSPQAQQVLQQSTEFSHSRPSTRPNSSHNTMSLRNSVLPPTPPMISESSFGNSSSNIHDSPSTKSVSQLPSMCSTPATSVSARSSASFFEVTPPPQQQHHQHHHQQHPHHQHHQHHHHHEAAPPSRAGSESRPSSHPQQYQQAAAPSYHRHSHSHSQSYHQPQPQRRVHAAYNYHAAPTVYYPAMQPTPPPQQQQQQQMPGLYYQRPLPTFMPPVQPSPWQHHHYISPSAAAAFPQSQDRYICPTCNKAFSRPSSLRIHSHSHTGEKPFKCPHQGCGKAFSVRSNMKRHERGCHSYEA